MEGREGGREREGRGMGGAGCAPCRLLGCTHARIPAVLACAPRCNTPKLPLTSAQHAASQPRRSTRRTRAHLRGRVVGGGGADAHHVAAPPQLSHAKAAGQLERVHLAQDAAHGVVGQGTTCERLLGRRRCHLARCRHRCGNSRAQACCCRWSLPPGPAGSSREGPRSLTRGASPSPTWRSSRRTT